MAQYNSMDTLNLTGIKAETLIGVYANERDALQPIVIDLTLLFDAQKAILSDDVSHTIHYQALTESLCAFVKTQTCQLIETLADHIANFILGRYPIIEASVCVQKPNILPNAETISITIHRKSPKRKMHEHDTNQLANTLKD